MLVHIGEKFGIGEKYAPYLGEYFKFSCRCRSNENELFDFFFKELNFLLKFLYNMH